MKKLIALIVAALALPAAALAQSPPSPAFYYRFVPTAEQWNSYFTQKQDYLGYQPINKNGDVFLGRVVLWPSATTAAGVNVGVGTAPTTPVPGDLWATPNGFYGYVNGQVIGPFGTSPTGLANVGGGVQVTSGIQSTSPTTGGFTVVGGEGVGGNINAGGNIAAGGNAVITGNLSVGNDISWWSQAGIPTTAQIAPSTWGVWKDTTGGGVYVAANDGGTMKSVPLVSAAAPTRTMLTGSLTYYVNPAGNDNCNGTSATLGTSGACAFLTMQKAYSVIAGTLDLAGNAVTVQLADGTYTQGLNVNQAWTGGGAVTFQGNLAAMSNVVISTVGSNAIGVGATNPGTLTFQYMRLTATTGGSALSIFAPGVVNYGNIDFGPAVGGYHVLASGTGVNVASVGPSTISGGAVSHWAATANAIVNDAGRTITLTGTPAFTQSFAYGSRGGVVACNGDTFVGTGTGPKYTADTAGGIFTSGTTATTYLPTATAGTLTTATYGWYN